MVRPYKLQAERFIYLILAIIFTIWSSFALASDLRTIALITVWITSIIFAIPTFALPMRYLQRTPVLMWLLCLISICAVIVIWLVRFQSAVGLELTLTERLWLVGMITSLMILPFAGKDNNEVVTLGWLAGPLVTLTTITVIIIGIELGLRYMWVMSDNFQFSKLHQNWHRLYWNPINELGYRDFDVLTADDERTNLLVLGDSLVTGYGVDDIADTFPQLLDDSLGANTTVNIVAQPGWSVASSFGALQAYPIMPDKLILSHYINDINEGTAAQQYRRAFPNIRLEPSDNQRWWVDNFYIANFLYYRVFLYTQYDSLGLYNEWVYGAYADSQVWSAYQAELQQVVDWSRANDIPLTVIVWGDLVNMDASQTLTQPIINFFTVQGVPVVDMSVILADVPLNQRIVNPFDAHPSVQSHRLAAEALVDILTE